MKFNHDTSYFGYDILSTINNVLGKPAMDRGGIYIWAQDNAENPMVLFYNAHENDGRGALEMHRTGSWGTFVRQIDCNGVLDLNDEGDDCVFNKEKITNFISKFC